MGTAAAIVFIYQEADVCSNVSPQLLADMYDGVTLFTVDECALLLLIFRFKVTGIETGNQQSTNKFNMVDLYRCSFGMIFIDRADIVRCPKG